MTVGLGLAVCVAQPAPDPPSSTSSWMILWFWGKNRTHQILSFCGAQIHESQANQDSKFCRSSNRSSRPLRVIKPRRLAEEGKRRALSLSRSVLLFLHRRDLLAGFAAVSSARRALSRTLLLHAASFPQSFGQTRKRLGQRANATLAIQFSFVRVSHIFNPSRSHLFTVAAAAHFDMQIKLLMIGDSGTTESPCASSLSRSKGPSPSSPLRRWLLLPMSHRCWKNMPVAEVCQRLVLSDVYHHHRNRLQDQKH